MTFKALGHVTQHPPAFGDVVVHSMHLAIRVMDSQSQQKQLVNIPLTTTKTMYFMINCGHLSFEDVTLVEQASKSMKNLCTQVCKVWEYIQSVVYEEGFDVEVGDPEECGHQAPPFRLSAVCSP